ncbi:MAG: hypothetical protein FGM46_09555 [Ferruginibacter sp.]|nr:hypothetical protein [Ferruginibacter sp.]
MKSKIIQGLMAAVILLSSCNKEPQVITENTVNPPAGPAVGEVLDGNDNDSLYFRLVNRAGQISLINDKSKSFTLFVPDNNGIKPVLVGLAAQAGITIPLQAPDAVFSAFISQIPVTVATALVQYNIIPQTIKSSGISNTFPNFSYPTVFNPAPNISSLARLNTYPSTRNGAWLNNIPITGVDQMASNGVIHHTATLVLPGNRYLWDRISTDDELTYLKAAILKADEGAPAAESLQGYLSSFGPDFTIFAPVDNAFKETLTGLITQVLYNNGNGLPLDQAFLQASALASTPDVFSNPALASVLTPQTVKGIVVYHVLGKRAFTNNFPTTQTSYPTLLNTVVSSHPGLKLQATFNPPSPFVSVATVKDVYNNNAAANIIINSSPLTPDPSGTSDQNFINGVLHKIDKVLLPQ